jgi:hypothetical protein
MDGQSLIHDFPLTDKGFLRTVRIAIGALRDGHRSL